jgi:hypothetical protein
MIVDRCADDLAVGFGHEGDARRFLDVMRERLGEFALSLHPTRPTWLSSAAMRRSIRQTEFLGFNLVPVENHISTHNQLREKRSSLYNLARKCQRVDNRVKKRGEGWRAESVLFHRFERTMFLDHFKDLPDHRQAGDVSYPARGDPAFDAVAVNTRRSEHDDALAGVFHSSP